MKLALALVALPLLLLLLLLLLPIVQRSSASSAFAIEEAENAARRSEEVASEHQQAGAHEQRQPAVSNEPPAIAAENIQEIEPAYCEELRRRRRLVRTASRVEAADPDIVAALEQDLAANAARSTPWYRHRCEFLV